MLLSLQRREILWSMVFFQSGINQRRPFKERELQDPIFSLILAKHL
jgi:hypothetical protein